MLWDRFGWGPEQTSKLTLAKLREMFAVLEQQRVDRDYRENLGGPDPERMHAMMEAQNAGKTKFNSVRAGVMY